LQKAEGPGEYAQILLSGLLPLVQGGCGACYLFQEEAGRFQFSGGYGYQQRSEIAPSFALGEGIVGQCAAERKAITLRDVPPEYIRIASGLGESPPRIIVAVPLLSLERVLGVIEVASFSPLTELQRATLDEVARAAALNLEILLRNMKTRELLERT